MDDAMDWERVGRYVDRRIDEMGITKTEFSNRSGISDVTLNRYIAGAPIVRPDKASGLCAALRWTRDSIERIGTGGEPIEVAGTSEAPAAVTEWMAQIQTELSDIRAALDAVARHVGADISEK